VQVVNTTTPYPPFKQVFGIVLITVTLLLPILFLAHHSGIEL